MTIEPWIIKRARKYKTCMICEVSSPNGLTCSAECADKYNKRLLKRQATKVKYLTKFDENRIFRDFFKEQVNGAFINGDNECVYI